MKAYLVTITLLALNLARAYVPVYEGETCKSCISDSIANTTYAAVCMSPYSEKVAYCCEHDEMDTQLACKNSPACSWNITVDYMKPVTCPIKEHVCGRSSPSVKLGENQTEQVSITRFFDEFDSCRFTYSAYD